MITNDDVISVTRATIQYKQSKPYQPTPKELESSPAWRAFRLHEKLVDEIYGPLGMPFSEAILPPKLTEQLTKYLASLEPLAKSYIEEMLENLDKNLNFQANKPSIKKWQNNTSGFWSLDPREDLIIKLHDFIRVTFKDYLKSPIAIVNTTAWCTKPNSERFGPNTPHADGFPPGHLKAMVYLTDLSEETGNLYLNGRIAEDRPKGTVVIFQNSDVTHCGVPGTLKERLCIEVTVMRSLVPLEQKHESRFMGRHLHSPELAYKFNK